MAVVTVRGNVLTEVKKHPGVCTQCSAGTRRHVLWVCEACLQ